MKLSKRKIEHWGTECEVYPELIEKIYGDGKQLMYLNFMDMRPNYYLVWIDSSVNLQYPDKNNIDFFAFLEIEVMEYISETYGEYCGLSDENIDDFEFPALINIGSGYGWGKVDNTESDYTEALTLKEEFQK